MRSIKILWMITFFCASVIISTTVCAGQLSIPNDCVSGAVASAAAMNANWAAIEAAVNDNDTRINNIGPKQVQGRFHFVTYKSPSTTPVAYGAIDYDGSVLSGSGNFSCSWDSTYKRYEITITSYSYIVWDYTTVVTALGDPLMASTNSISGKLLVNIFSF
jgi:hypothetical protein